MGVTTDWRAVSGAVRVRTGLLVGKLVLEGSALWLLSCLDLLL